MAIPALSLTLDLQGIRRLQDRLANAELSILKAKARAMTAAAFDAERKLQAATREYVDRPTRFTLNAWTHTPRYVDKFKLEVEVGLKVLKPGYEHYLRPMIRGGDRWLKRSERRLGSRYFVPTGLSPVTLNQYGNVSQGTYQAVLSQLRVADTSGATANASNSPRSRAKRQRRAYFIGELNDGRKAIYARTSRENIKPVFVFLSSGNDPNYERSFPADEIARKEFWRSYQVNLRKFLAL